MHEQEKGAKKTFCINVAKNLLRGAALGVKKTRAPVFKAKEPQALSLRLSKGGVYQGYLMPWKI